MVDKVNEISEVTNDKPRQSPWERYQAHLDQANSVDDSNEKLDMALVTQMSMDTNLNREENSTYKEVEKRLEESTGYLTS